MRSKRLTSPSRCPVKNYLFELPLHRKYSPDVSFRSANHPRPAQSRPPFAAHSPSRALRFPPRLSCFGFLRPSLARSPSSAPMPYPKDLSPVLPHRLCALKTIPCFVRGSISHPSIQSDPHPVCSDVIDGFPRPLPCNWHFRAPAKTTCLDGLVVVANQIPPIGIPRNLCLQSGFQTETPPISNILSRVCLHSIACSSVPSTCEHSPLIFPRPITPHKYAAHAHGTPLP